MQDLKVFVAECAQSKAESIPVSTQEYIDGYASIAFPPPSVGQFQEFQLVLLCEHSAKVVDGCDSIVPVLNYADILVAGVNAKSYKGIFFRQFFKDVIAHKYVLRILCIQPLLTYINKSFGYF
jgi:hypothetical protein